LPYNYIRTLYTLQLYSYPRYNYNIVDQLSYCVHNMYLWRVWTRLTRQLFLLFTSMNNNNKCSTTYFWTVIILALYSLKIKNCRAFPVVEWLLLWNPPAAKPNGLNLKISDSASTRVGSSSPAFKEYIFELSSARARSVYSLCSGKTSRTNEIREYTHV